jgi:pimeloyl-ACP methyl ester carboxylesterase
MGIEQMVADLDQLVDRLLQRFGRRKVVLLGHSWDTVLGVLHASRFPSKIAAYFGAAQVVNVVAARQEELGFALGEARKRNDARAMAALSKLGPPPLGVEQALELEEWTERFGGLFAGRLRKRDLIMAALHTGEANLLDLALFGLGNRFSCGRCGTNTFMWPSTARTRGWRFPWRSCSAGTCPARWPRDGSTPLPHRGSGWCGSSTRRTTRHLRSRGASMPP